MNTIFQEKSSNKLLIMPIKTAKCGRTNPLAGVIPTRAATEPEQNPFKDIFGVLWKIISVITHVRPPKQAAKFVTTNAFTALELMANSHPELKPNHPNHKSAVPYYFDYFMKLILLLV